MAAVTPYQYPKCTLHTCGCADRFAVYADLLLFMPADAKVYLELFMFAHMM